MYICYICTYRYIYLSIYLSSDIYIYIYKYIYINIYIYTKFVISTIPQRNRKGINYFMASFDVLRGVRLDLIA